MTTTFISLPKTSTSIHSLSSLVYCATMAILEHAWPPHTLHNVQGNQLIPPLIDCPESCTNSSTLCSLLKSIQLKFIRKMPTSWQLASYKALHSTQEKQQTSWPSLWTNLSDDLYTSSTISAIDFLSPFSSDLLSSSIIFMQFLPTRALDWSSPSGDPW